MEAGDKGELRLPGGAGDGEAGVRGGDGGDGEAVGLEVICNRGELFGGCAELLGELLRGQPVVEARGGVISLGGEELVERGGLGCGGLETDGKGERLGDGKLAGVDRGARGDCLGRAGGDGKALCVEQGRGGQEKAQEREGA